MCLKRSYCSWLWVLKACNAVGWDKIGIYTRGFKENKMQFGAALETCKGCIKNSRIWSGPAHDFLV